MSGPVEQVQAHELVARDAAGYRCSCGERTENWLEHLGDVALNALGAPPAGRFERSQARAKARREALEDAAWLREQQRLDNFASFGVELHPFHRPAERRIGLVDPDRALQLALDVFDQKSPEEQKSWKRPRPDRYAPAEDDLDIQPERKTA